MKLRLKYPASWWRNMWREALPSGNGTIGASVYGGVQEETIVVNHADLWHWGRRDPLPDVSHTLAETRRHMDEGKYLEASWHLTNALKERGYATRLASRLPLAAMRLTMPSEQAFRNYERTLDMDTGEVTVGWSDGAKRLLRRLFVSRADNCIVYDIRCDRSGGVNGEIGIGMMPSERWKDEPEYRKLEQSITVQADGEFVTYAGQNDDGTEFGAVVRLVVDGGRTTAERDGISFAGADRVLAIAKVFVGCQDREQEWMKLKRELASMEEGYGELLERHVKLHRPLVRSASLSLEGDAPEWSKSESNKSEWNASERIPYEGSIVEDVVGPSAEQLLMEAYEGEASTELVQLMWTYGRYLFVSGTDSASQPFGLYGLWAGDYRLMWGHNMANENIQMMYWHAHVGGLGHMADSLFRYYNGMLKQFRDNAKKLYGCGGIYIPAGTTPGIGRPNQIVPVIMNWTGAAGWLARHYYEHYLFTGDDRFLREKAWPFMREAAAFYEDFLVTDVNGNYRIYPSVSPENTPLNHMPVDGESMAHPMPTTINATMDFAIIKELLQSLIDAGPSAGESEEQLQHWRDMLRRIPPYEVNGDGAVREWMHADFEDRYEHRHLSHLYPVFPGHEIDRDEQPELFAAFDTAVRMRKLGAQTGWSLSHMASIYARLGDGDSALACLDMLSRSCLLPNLWTLHNDWRGMGISMNIPTAPVQLDANMGWVNAVQEMLLYVSPKLVKLLPALPAKWRKGSVTDWRFCTGRLSMAWDLPRGHFEARVHAERETAIDLQLPDRFPQCAISGEGVYRIERLESGKLRYRMAMEKGAVITIGST